MVGRNGITMSNVSSLYEQNLDGLKDLLASNRLNGFADLPAKHRLFALEYFKEPNHYKAAEAADIGRASAIRTLRDPLVQEFLKYLREKQEHYTLIDKSFIEVQYLTLYGKLLGEDEVPMVDKDGCAFKAKKFHASEAVSALRDMAKSVEFFKDEGAKVNVSVGVNNFATVDLTDEQKAILDAALNEQY